MSSMDSAILPNRLTRSPAAAAVIALRASNVIVRILYMALTVSDDAWTVLYYGPGGLPGSLDGG